jgi:NAD(P) transhydrogenase subunit beta
MSASFIQGAYLVATALFVFSLHWMNDPKTARRGVFSGVAAMLIAVVSTWAQPVVVHHLWIVIPILFGVALGWPLALVPLTAVPQRTALSHAFGGLAAGLVGTAKFDLWHAEGPENLTTFRMIAIIAEIILGYLTFTGSLMAAGKLQEVKWIPQRPVTYRGQNLVNIGAMLAAVAIGAWLVMNPADALAPKLFPVIIGLALLFGVMLIIPIGGADMPTVIAILNSYAGLSAVAMGFVLDNRLLITAALDGASGFILSIIMSRAMNRSFANVLFGAFGKVQQVKAGGEEKVYKRETVESAAQIIEQAQLVVIVPGYGMAVAQAQQKVRELYDQLKKRGIAVKFAIHPVAGRMPGHMNVLLAEADIPYTDLAELDDINSEMPQCDVALVVGANDVVNPAARTDKTSPIYGMPIIDADKARTVFAIKRSKNPGFAGIDNELYFSDKTWMLFGDAKNVIGELVKQLSGGSKSLTSWPPPTPDPRRRCWSSALPGSVQFRGTISVRGTDAGVRGPPPRSGSSASVSVSTLRSAPPGARIAQDITARARRELHPPRPPHRGRSVLHHYAVAARLSSRSKKVPAGTSTTWRAAPPSSPDVPRPQERNRGGSCRGRARRSQSARSACSRRARA